MGISDKVIEYLRINNPSALDFWLRYRNYIHDVDDIIDEKITDSNHIIDCFAQSSQVYGHPFFQENRNLLMVIDILTSNTYRDSNTMMLKGDSQDKIASGVLAHCGYNMLMAIILIVGGQTKLNEFSLEIRELCHRS